MEMPEGWKFIKQAIEDSEIDNEEVIPSIYTAMDLMKEMAEALENCEACTAGTMREWNFPVLKKFKEWN